MHRRRALIDDLKNQLLLAGHFGAGVWNTRLQPKTNSYPCVTLFAESETVTHTTMHPAPRGQLRTLNISVNAWYRGAVDIEKPETDMDAGALLIEQTLRKPVAAADLQLTGSEYREADDDPELFIVALSYQISYQATEYNPQ